MRVPQAPRTLTPQASLLHYFGAELRHWRERSGLSQDRLGAQIYVSGDLVAKVEKAVRFPSATLAADVDAALGTGGALARLWPLVDAARRVEAQTSHEPAPETAQEATREPASGAGAGAGQPGRRSSEDTDVRALLRQALTALTEPINEPTAEATAGSTSPGRGRDSDDLEHATSSWLGSARVAGDVAQDADDYADAGW